MTNKSEEASLYVQTFFNDSTKFSVEPIHTRLTATSKLSDELAEYFRDRAIIEETYARNIAKLSKKTYITNKSTLGTFLPLWEKLCDEMNELATNHIEYATSIVDNIEKPLKSAASELYSFVSVYETSRELKKIAHEYEDLENKIQKVKRTGKSDSKVTEYMQVQESKLATWQKKGPKYLKDAESIERDLWQNLKSIVRQFQVVQQEHAHRIIEMSESLMTFAGEFDANNEVAIFCALHSDGVSPAQQTRALDAEQPSSLIDIDQIVPEPSVSNISSNPPASSSTPPTPSSGKKDRRKFFSSLVSIRRKPKSDAHHGNSLSVGLFHNGRQRSASNAGSFVESLHSVGSHNTTEPQHHESEFDKPSNNFDLTSPSSPTSVHSASVRNAPSINENLTHMSSQQPPLILVDSEGYSIPPPDRTAWPHDANTTNDSLVDTDDMYSDAGSSMLSSPRIRVDIKNESVTEEDASQSAVALTRVATLLKEKNSSNSPTTRRLRGRREIRATQLYSVVEQDQSMSNKDELSNVTPSTTSSGPLLPNPFEMSQEKITEEEEKEEEKLPTIHVHTTETLHVISKGGLAEQSVVWGEISIEYDGPKGTLTPVCFKANKAFDSLETTKYVDKLEDHDNVFKINTHLFHSEAVVCIKYQTKIDKERLPLFVKPMWKCEVDKSRLLIKYLATSPPLDNVVFVTMVTGNVQHASSIPDGELILAQKRMKWQLGRIDHPQESVIKAQFGTTEQGEPQPIAVRFEMKDQLLSDAYIEQGGESIPSLIWAKMGNSFKTIKTGKYVAEV